MCPLVVIYQNLLMLALVLLMRVSVFLWQIFQDRPGGKERCEAELRKSRRAFEMSALFALSAGHRPPRLQFAQLQMAPVDQVSLLNKLMSTKRKPASGEWILLEEIVHEHHSLQRFVNKFGETGSGRSGSRFKPECNMFAKELIEAFVHFSFHVSNGEEVVCGLEGGVDELGRVKLKTPIIHSRDRRYGETDLGPDGVQLVMQHHTCSSHCRRLVSLSRASSTPSLLTPSSSSSSLGTCDVTCLPRQMPTAPYDPDLLLPRSGLSTRCPSHPFLSANAWEDLRWCAPPMDITPPSPGEFPNEAYFLFKLELDKPVPNKPPPSYSQAMDQEHIISSCHYLPPYSRSWR